MILAVLLGCLPHGAVSRGEDVQAVVYELRWADAPAEAPALHLSRQYARSFSDGTSGWLVCLEEPGRCAELRAFPTGEVVQVRGTGAWTAEERGRLAAVWPVLSPRLEREPELYTGWPAGPMTHATVRFVAQGGWQRDRADWSWKATVESQGLSAATVRGTIEATARVERGELVSATWSAALPWCAPGGGCVPWGSAGSLTRVGTATHRPLVACPQRGEDERRAPLCLADGTAVADPPDGLDLVSFLGADPATANPGTLEERAPR